MKKITLLAFFCFLGLLSAQAQYQFTFKGTLAGKNITMHFYPDNNDGNVSGHYYYGDGSSGYLNFIGTAQPLPGGGFRQNLEERNTDDVVTGYFTGVLKNGVMSGTWVSTDGKRSYTYRLVLQKK
ncbi:MAG: hypothetical protein OHK0053_30350 [Microscillaceae bacterium]